jgi:hypothetical protein
MQHIVLVDPEGPSTEGIGNADGSVEILGVNCGGEIVVRVISALENLLLCL